MHCFPHVSTLSATRSRNGVMRKAWTHYILSDGFPSLKTENTLDKSNVVKMEVI